MPSPTIISIENARQGTRDWLLNSPRVDPDSPFRCPWIEGYCGQTSVRAGETLDIHVSTRPESEFTIDVYRMGYYGGAGGRLVTHIGPLTGKAQNDPFVEERRLRECRWSVSASLRIPQDWVSGIYLGKLTAMVNGVQSYIIFIVHDERNADFIFKCSDTTWHAYSRWPEWYAIYDDGKSNWYCGPNVEVSFDRPFSKYCTAGDRTRASREWHNAPLSCGSGEFLLWEFPTAYWMESQGYDVAYISSIDVHTGAAALTRAKGLLSVGHDEYYTIEMYRNLRAEVSNGLSIAFLSGNTCNCVIALSPNAAGEPNRRMQRVDYFGPRNDVMAARFARMGDFPYRSPNEGQLLGARNVFPCTGGADWICTAQDHWLYANTGMKAGDRISGLIGWEWHGDPAPIPGLAIVASGQTESRPWDGSPGETLLGVYSATVYPGPLGNFVFNASTIWWGDGLAQPPGYVRPSVYTTPQGPDRRVQKMMENLLKRMMNR